MTKEQKARLGRIRDAYLLLDEMARRLWPELDLRSDFILGPIVAHYIREVKGPTLGLSKSLRDAVLAFDYVKDVAP